MYFGVTRRCVDTLTWVLLDNSGPNVKQFFVSCTHHFFCDLAEFQIVAAHVACPSGLRLRARPVELRRARADVELTSAREVLASRECFSVESFLRCGSVGSNGILRALFG